MDFFAQYNISMEKIKSSKIWKFIEENDYTLKQFRVKVGISKRELSKILTGRFDFKFSSLIKIASFCDIPVNWLIEDNKKEVQTKFYL